MATPFGASRGSILLLAGLAFLSGGVIGAIADHKLYCGGCGEPACTRQRATWAEDQVERWTRALGLTADQRGELAAAITSLKPRYDKAYGAACDRRRAVDEAFEERLRGILKGPQNARFDEIVALEQRRRAEYYGVAADLATSSPELGQDECSGEDGAQ